MNIARFISQLTNTYNLKFHTYNDGDYSQLPYAVRLEMKFENNLYESWGVSHERDLAFFKALMEIIERICLSVSCPLFYKRNFLSRKLSINNLSIKYSIPVLNLYPDNSNGLALGLNPYKTKKSAFYELVERHTILSALYLGISPQRIPDVSYNFPDHQFKFYYWKCNNLFVVLAVDILPNGGFLFTHACSENLSKAISKAFEEMVPNIIFFDKNRDLNEDCSSVEYNNIMSFNKYWKYSRDNRVLTFLENKQSKVKTNIPSLKNIFYGKSLIPKPFMESKLPLYCFRAISPDAQQLFFDNWDEIYINPKYRGQGHLPNFPHIIS